MLSPKENTRSGGCATYGGSYNAVFHTADSDEIEEWFKSRKFEIVPISEVLDHLFFLRVTDPDKNPVRDLQSASFTVNKGLKSDVWETMPGVYAFDLLNHSTKHFEIITERGSKEFRSEDMAPLSVTDVVL